MTTEAITILSGHVSPETAYLVADYPYGFRLRCSIRYWLEFDKKRGTRFMSQTSNPKLPGLVWNKPKASTYSRFGGCMYLDDAGHVQHSGLHEYMDGAQTIAWADKFGAGVPEAGREMFARWVAAKKAYDARPADENMHIKAAHARVAFAKHKMEG
jgi:hypothetical protein